MSLTEKSLDRVEINLLAAQCIGRLALEVNSQVQLSL
jgi:hypothetical protein